MRVSRFYLSAPLTEGEVVLEADLAHYVSRVLRLNVGAAVQLFNGSGVEWPGELLEVGKRQVRVRLQPSIPGLPESPLRIHLGQSMSRGDRMDWAIQKATELGANEITPLQTERCEVRLQGERADKRQAHWQQVAISACEQCGRSKVPTVHAPMALEDWLANLQAELKLVLHHRTPQRLDQLTKPSSLAVLIGPEGGLSDAEIASAEKQGFQSACFGPRVLRTETAPIVALSLAQQLWGDF
ncbi:MAG: 16S rRNA (uracil(1498)-N(3))-methyltransferase [Pseudomonas sp.]